MKLHEASIDDVNRIPVIYKIQIHPAILEKTKRRIIDILKEGRKEV